MLDVKQVCELFLCTITHITTSCQQLAYGPTSYHTISDSTRSLHGVDSKPSRTSREHGMSSHEEHDRESVTCLTPLFSEHCDGLDVFAGTICGGSIRNF